MGVQLFTLFLLALRASNRLQMSATLYQSAGGCAVRVSRILTAVLCGLSIYGSGLVMAQSEGHIAPALTLQTGAFVSVVGVVQGKQKLRKSTRKHLQDHRIGFGLSTLLAEVLFDTGRFRLVEAKAIEERQLLEELVSTYWIKPPAAQYAERDLQRVATQLDVKLLAHGRVAHRRVSQRRVSFGPLSRHQQKLRIQVRVCLYDATTRANLCRAGEGEAQQLAQGVIYDFHGDRVAFTQNATGQATKQAMVAAVEKLVADIHFVPAKRRAEQR